MNKYNYRELMVGKMVASEVDAFVIDFELCSGNLSA